MFGIGKKIKLKNNIQGLVIFVSIVMAFILIYLISNYRKFNTIILNGNNSDFYITNGIMIYNPEVNLIKIDNISYNNSDFLIESISLELSSSGKENKVLKTIDYSSKEPISIIEYLKTIRINASNQLTKKMIDSDLQLKIDIFTADKRILNTKIILNQIKYTNNQLLYFK